MIEVPLLTHRAELLRAIENKFDLYGIPDLAGLGGTQSGDTSDTRLSLSLLLVLASSDMWRACHLLPTNLEE